MPDYLYRFPVQPVKARFIKRYKRFLVDAELPDGRIVTAHSTNTGSLKSCLIPGAEILMTPSQNSKRKTAYTWEAIHNGETWIGVNTKIPNVLICSALKRNRLAGFETFNKVFKEITFRNSRFDLYLENKREKLFIEIKNVTYRKGDYALFPDAPTKRGLKHLEELLQAKKEGYRAAMIFVVQRLDVRIFRPAPEIHNAYADMLKRVVSEGIEVYAVRAGLDESGVYWAGYLPVELD